MKKIFAVVLAVMITGSVFAMDFTKWNSSLEDSSWIIDAGVGYGLGVAVPVSAEYLLPIDFPIGVLVEVTPSFMSDFFWLNALAGVNYHPDFGLENMDIYMGIKLGYMYYSYPAYDYTDPFAPKTIRSGMSGFGFGAHLGYTYYFTDNIGIDVKAGYPTYISASVAFKL